MRGISSITDPTFIRFAIVGAICFGANIAVLYVCVEGAGLHYIFAMAISILVAYTLGWMLNRKWTFRSKNDRLLIEYLRFVAANLGSMLVSICAMMLLVSGFHMNYMLASAMIAIVMMLANFAVHRSWTFAGRD